MTRFVIDSHAWIEYLVGTDKGDKVRTFITNPKNEIFTSAVTVSEIISKFKREGKDASQAWHILHSLSRIIAVDSMLAKGAGEVHAEVKKTSKNFSLADAFVLHTARLFRAKVITGDPDFKGIKEVVMI